MKKFKIPESVLLKKGNRRSIYKSNSGYKLLVDQTKKACQAFELLSGIRVNQCGDRGIVLGVDFVPDNIGEKALWFYFEGDKGATHFHPCRTIENYAAEGIYIVKPRERKN